MPGPLLRTLLSTFLLQHAWAAIRGPPRRRQRMPSLADKLASSDLECRLCLEGKGEGPTFHLGLGTFRVPMALHEANRIKLAEMMPEGSCGVALLQGGDQQTRYDTDHEPVFRQESYFQYLFGVSEAGCFGAVSLPRSAHALSTLSARSAWTLFEVCTRCTRCMRCALSASLPSLSITLSAPSPHPLQRARHALRAGAGRGVRGLLRSLPLPRGL